MKTDLAKPKFASPPASLALALLLLQAAGTAIADAADEVRCREIGFSRAAEMRDAVRFESFIDADARFVGQSVVRGPDAVVAAWAAFFSIDGPSIAWRPQFVEVLENGTLALSRGPYRVSSIGDDGQPMERWGTFNSVWRLHEDGLWRVVFDAGSAPVEAPTDEQRALLDADDDCPAS